MKSTVVENKKFAQMTVVERLMFVGAVVVFVCTFGFLFPNLLHDDDYVQKYG